MRYNALMWSPSRIVLVAVSPAAIWVAACASGSSSTAGGASELAGTSWQLVRFQGNDDTSLTPNDGAKYTLSFGADGRVIARIDCNRGNGTWTSDGSGQVRFGPLALTRAMCPPGSLHDRIVRDWEYFRTYLLQDGHLFLDLMADGGTYEFEPASAASD